MTPQEAISLVKECGLNIEGTLYTECENAILTALQKQISKKPTKKNPIIYLKSIDGEEWYAYNYHCPICDVKLKLFEHHCHCGQALDWREVSE